ncbi:MAG: hypothetical protein ACPG05_00830 [Bdellovibrionales bacterium]
MKHLPLILIACFSLMVSSAHAEEPVPKPQTPETQTVEDITKQLYESFDEEKREKFGRIIAANSIIKSTTHTMEILQQAASSCKKNQPDLKSEISKNFKAFEGQINPILKTARGALKRTLKLAEVLSYKEMNAYLKKIDEEALAKHEEVEIFPASNLEDCTRFSEKIKQELETSRLKNTLNKAFGFEVEDQ